MENKFAKIIYSIIIVAAFTGCKPEDNIKTQVPQKTDTVPTIEWVTIPYDTFAMGSDQNENGHEDHYEVLHSVILDSFKLSKYEVTFDQYDYYCEKTGKQKPDDNGWGRGKRPVINVSYYDAVEYAKFMNCRLPTDSEWEYACRCRKTYHSRYGISHSYFKYKPFNTGDTLLTDQANYDGIQPYVKNPTGLFLNKTMDVGSYKPNALGLYDMHGNVMEWCFDWHDYIPGIRDYGGTSTSYCDFSKFLVNPKGPATGVEKILRGGSFMTPAYRCRTAFRNRVIPTYSGNMVGIRLASDM
jgi:hypothetical protein